MNRTILASLFTALLVPALHAEQKSRKSQPIEPPVTLPRTPATPRLYDFQGDEIGLVLRTVARNAKLSIVVGDYVTGTVTALIEDKTPRQTLDIIAAAKELILEDKKGVLYVRPKNPPPPGTPKAPDPEKPLDEALSELSKVYDSLLDYQARPETAQKIAKAKKALYDALIAEGFTKEEAFRIILTNQELSILNANK